MTLTSHKHGDAIFVSLLDRVFVTYGTSRLDDSLDAELGGNLQKLRKEWEDVYNEQELRLLAYILS